MFKVPLYCHFFAIEAYNQFVQLKNKAFFTSDIPVKINDVESIVSPQSLDKVCELFLMLQNLESKQGVGYLGDKQLLGTEQTLSCLFAEAVDQFLFSTMNTGKCFHQLPSRFHYATERPDLYVLSLEGGFFPKYPVLLADVKKLDIEKARSETGGYVITAMEVCSPDTSILLLGLPLTQDKVELHALVLKANC